MKREKILSHINIYLPKISLTVKLSDQFVPVPSLFFIGRNGTPLEVVCAGVEPQSLATRIDRILQEHRKLVFGMLLI